MVVIRTVTFYKAIVIQSDIFGSVIVDERHFKTAEQAEQFKREVTAGTDLLCMYVRCKENRVIESLIGVNLIGLFVTFVLPYMEAVEFV